jgi:hypothetical protein
MQQLIGSADSIENIYCLGQQEFSERSFLSIKKAKALITQPKGQAPTQRKFAYYKRVLLWLNANILQRCCGPKEIFVSVQNFPIVEE